MSVTRMTKPQAMRSQGSPSSAAGRSDTPGADAEPASRVEHVAGLGQAGPIADGRSHEVSALALAGSDGPAQARAMANGAPVVAAKPQHQDDDEPQHGFWARLYHRVEARISALSTRNNFWHRLCSWIWLPLAYRSGIKFSKGDESTFSAILPFRKFNKNWYNAMAGGALLGNAEVAGGMYVFKKCGTEYTVVCKHLAYTFRRPCHGPAVYRVEPREAIEELVATGEEFNITVDMTIVQMVRKPGDRERRVGGCTATFHVTPKDQHRRRRFRRQQRDAARS